MSEVMIFSTSMSLKLSVKNIFDELQSDYANNVQHRALIKQFVNNLSELGQCLHPIDSYNLRRAFSSIYGVKPLMLEAPPFLFHGEDILRSDDIGILCDVMNHVHKRDTLAMSYLLLYVVSQGYLKCYNFIRENTCCLPYSIFVNDETIVSKAISSGNVELFDEVYRTYYFEPYLSTDRKIACALTYDRIRSDLHIPRLMRFMRTAFVFNRAEILDWLIDESMYTLNISPFKIGLYLRLMAINAFNEGFYGCAWNVHRSTQVVWREMFNHLS